MDYSYEKQIITRCNVLALHSLPGSGYRMLHPYPVFNKGLDGKLRIIYDDDDWSDGLTTIKCGEV